VRVGEGTKPWLRAPADEFVAAFMEGGSLAPLTEWVRSESPRADLHLWSDDQAQMHRARIVSGTIGVLDIDWSPVRFQVSARRPFTKLAAVTLDSFWHPNSAAAGPVARAVTFASRALTDVSSRTRFAVDALARFGMLTQDYAPLVSGPLTDATAVVTTQEALLPAPIPGGAPFFSAAPDAIVADEHGRLELVRTYTSRAPELRFAAAQAHVDLKLFGRPGDEQVRNLERIAASRRLLGLPAIGRPLSDAPVRAHVLVEAGASDRLVEQYEAVRTRLVERGVLDAEALRFTVLG